MAQRWNPRIYYKAGLGGTLGWMGYWLRSRARNAVRLQERAWRQRDAAYLRRPQGSPGLPRVGRGATPSFAGS